MFSILKNVYAGVYITVYINQLTPIADNQEIHQLEERLEQYHVNDYIHN